MRTGKTTALILAGLGVAIFVAGIAVLLRQLSGSGSLGRTADLPVLVRQIQQLNELVTVKYSVQKIIGLEERKQPFGAEKLLLIVQADVLAGVDLGELDESRMRWLNDGGLLIALPEPRVLHVVLDEEETRVWDRQITWWTPWVPFSPDLERQARLAAVADIQKTAMEKGILDDARRSAEQSIRVLLEAAGIKRVQFSGMT